MDEEVKEIITEDAPKRGRKPAESSGNSEVNELKAQVQALMEQNKLLMQALSGMSGQANQSVNAVQSNLKDEVKIVHLVQRARGLSTYMKLSNLEVILTEFGEERYLTVQQFEEMLGKYRRWFDSGMLSLAAGYEDVARRYALKTAAQYPMDSEFVKNLGNMGMDAIADMYKKLPESGKEFIISYWKQKIIEEDMNFKDINKITILNNISNGGLENVLIEMKKK